MVVQGAAKSVAFEQSERGGSEAASGKHSKLQPVQSVLDVQVFAHVPLLSRTLPSGQAEAHLPLAQLPLQHCGPLVQFFPMRLQPGGSAAASPMPRDASVPPTRAAPINLSALRLESSPLASPLVSSSKERSLASGDIGYPFPLRAGH